MRRIPVGTSLAVRLVIVAAALAFGSEEVRGVELAAKSAVCDYDWTNEACGLGGDTECNFCCTFAGPGYGGMCVANNLCLCF